MQLLWSPLLRSIKFALLPLLSRLLTPTRPIACWLFVHRFGTLWHLSWPSYPPIFPIVSDIKITAKRHCNHQCCTTSLSKPLPKLRWMCFLHSSRVNTPFCLQKELKGNSHPLNMHDYVQARILVNSMNTKNISAPIFKVGLKIQINSLCLKIRHFDIKEKTQYLKGKNSSFRRSSMPIFFLQPEWIHLKILQFPIFMETKPS